MFLKTKNHLKKKKKKKRRSEREKKFARSLAVATRGKLSFYLATQLCNVTRGLSRFANKNMGYEIMHSYRIKEFRNLHIANKVTHLVGRSNDRYRNIEL